MKEIGLKATVRRPKTTKESKVQCAGYIYENLLARSFEAEYPNQKWVTDVTEVQINGAKRYISAIVDLFNREVIAIEISSSPNFDLIEATIKAAQKKRKMPNLEHVIIHSDQGNVYRSMNYNQLSKKLRFTPSMSRKANCWDNAVIESFFSHLKTELPCFYPDIQLETFEKYLRAYSKYYNEKRTHSSLGLVSPTTYYFNYLNAG